MVGTDSDGSFAAALRQAVRPRDCLALALVPVAAIAVFELPVEQRESLAFVYREPSVVTAYTAHFVHFDAAHLAVNVLGYALVAGFGYVFAVLSDHRRLFGVATATYLVAFPPALSLLNLAVPRDAVGYGLSGVNMAFAGLLTLVLVTYAARLDDRVRVRYAPGLFFAVIAMVSVVVLPVSTTHGIGVASAIVAVVYVVSARRSWTGNVTPHLRAGWFDAGVLGVVALLGYQFVGFESVTVAGGIVNLYVHLLGFCLGFIVPYTALVAGVVDADRGFLSD